MSNERFPVDSSKDLNRGKDKKKERSLHMGDLFVFVFSVFCSCGTWRQDFQFSLVERQRWTHCVMTSHLYTTRSWIKRKLYTETIYK